MTIPGTMGAAAVFGGSGGTDDIDFERLLIDEVKKKRAMQQVPFAGGDFPQMQSNPQYDVSAPNAPQLQRAEVMRDIMPSPTQAGGSMDNPLARPQGVGAGPNPIGVGPTASSPALASTPPAPAPMESPIARAMRENPRPEPRGVGGRIKDALMSIPYTLATGGGPGALIPNIVRGASGDLREQAWRRRVGESEGVYAKEAGFQQGQDAAQMQKNKYNLDVRQQGEIENQNERMYGAKTQDMERRTAEGQARASQAEERMLQSQQKMEIMQQQFQQKFEEQKRQFEENFQRAMTAAEQKGLQQEIQNDFERQRIGLSGANLGLSREQFNYQREQGKYITDPNSGETFMLKDGFKIPVPLKPEPTGNEGYWNQKPRR